MINTDIQVIFQVLSGSNLMNPGLPDIVMENTDDDGVLSLVGELFELAPESEEVELQITAHERATVIFLFDMAGGNAKDITVQVNDDNEYRGVYPVRFSTGEALINLLASNVAEAKKYLFILSVVPTNEIAFSSSLIQLGAVTSINELRDVVLGNLSTKQGQFLRINNSRVEAFNFIGDIEDTNQVEDYEYGSNDFLIPFDCTDGNLIGSFPTAVGCKGKLVAAKKVDASDNYLEIKSIVEDQTLDGELTVRLRNQGQCQWYMSNGVEWVGVASFRS